jgi:hypothetical protein
MKLVRLFTIFEAGETNRTAEVPGKKRRGFKAGGGDRSHLSNKPSPERDSQLHKMFSKDADASPNFFGGKQSSKMSLDDFPDDDDEGDFDDVGDVGDEPEWDDDAETDNGFVDEPMHSAPAAPEKEPEKAIPFTSKSEPPSKAMQGGKSAGDVKSDKATLKALSKALNSVRTSDDDLQDWIDDVIREIERAVRSGSDLSLPKFEATPDDLRDTGGSDEDEEF